MNESIISLKSKEARILFKHLSEVLAGHILEEVIVHSSDYRTFWTQILSKKEYTFRLTWNEALRLHSYLRFYIERNKQHTLLIDEKKIKSFPLYGLNVKAI